jgi:hypothetical protein
MTPSMSLILAGSISLDSNFKVKAVTGRFQYFLFIPLQDREGTDFFPFRRARGYLLRGRAMAMYILLKARRVMVVYSLRQINSLRRGRDY